MPLCGLLQALKLSKKKRSVPVDQPELAQQTTTAVYLPMDVWDMIKKYMAPREWAFACGTCRTTYKLRRLLGVAEVRMRLSNTEQGLVRQLRLDKWPACHTLCFNLRRIHEAVNVTEPQIEQIQQAGSLLPMLECLHIIGSYYDVEKAEGSVQALLTKVLAKHVSVLTLEIHVVGVPLNFPNLQHLVLHMLPFKDLEGYAAHFPAINELISLKTLYLKSSSKMRGTFDLQGCARLQDVALQKVSFDGPMTLPSGCRLHVFDEPALFSSVSLRPAFANLVSGLTLRHITEWAMQYPSGVPLLRWAPVMLGLKVLRLVLGKKSVQKFSLWDTVRIDFDSGKAPCLEVLEVIVDSSLSIHIDPKLPLRSIIVSTAGHLVLRHLSDPVSCHAPRDTLEKLYFQSGAPLLPAYNDCLETYYKTKLGPQMRLVKRYEGKQHGWTLQMPESFTPCNLQGCCCNACPQCLVRNGVPILCDKAWTKDGFDAHLGRYCRGWLDF